MKTNAVSSTALSGKQYAFTGSPINGKNIEKAMSTAPKVESGLISRFAAKGALVLAIASAIGLGTASCSKEDYDEPTTPKTEINKGSGVTTTGEIDKSKVCRAVQDTLFMAFGTLGIPIDSANKNPTVITTFSDKRCPEANGGHDCNAVWSYDTEASTPEASVYRCSDPVDGTPTRMKLTIDKDGGLKRVYAYWDSYNEEFQPYVENGVLQSLKMSDSVFVDLGGNYRYVGLKGQPGQVDQHAITSLKSVKDTLQYKPNADHLAIDTYTFYNVKAE